jgi:SAM-dependent methyltransferase
MTEPDPIVGDHRPVPPGLPHGSALKPPEGRPSGSSSWWQTPAGQLILAWEQAQFDRLLADIFGFHAVQLGVPQWPALRANRMPLHLVVSQPCLQDPPSLQGPASLQGPSSLEDPPSLQGPAALTVGDFQSLPFASSSLDLVVAPHVLELGADPRQTLREIERVLRPEGRLVLTGFNPVSLWGAQHLMGRTPAGLQRSPWISLPRLKDWYALLGLECLPAHHGVYRPHLAEAKWLERTRFLERAGDRWWPICGAVYLTVAVKRVQAIRTVGPDFRRSRLRAHPAAVGARRQSEPARDPALQCTFQDSPVDPHRPG